MTQSNKETTVDGLRFFGRMSAAISHDLKNTLSIMNESAGLIEDLALMAENKGRPLDPQRIHQLGATIKRQIQRNDGIVRNMNQFAHSVDHSFKEIGLTANLQMLSTICRRLTDARGVAVAVTPSDPDIGIVTRPFHLLHLVWLLLAWAMDHVDEGKRLSLQARSVQDHVHLECRGIAGATAAAAFPPDPWTELLELLAARVEMDTAQQAIVAVLPRRMAA